MRTPITTILALALALALAIQPTMSHADPMNRERLRPSHIVYVSFSTPPQPDTPRPTGRPSATLEAKAVALLGAEAKQWDAVIKWVRSARHHHRSLLALLGTKAAHARQPDARVVIAHPSPAPIGTPTDHGLIMSLHSGLAVIVPRPRLGDHADVLHQKIAIDVAHALTSAPASVRKALHELVPSIPKDEQALLRAIDDERAGTYFLGSIEAAVAFADQPAVIERLAMRPLTGDDAELHRALVGRVMLALRDGNEYPDDIYPALERMSPAIARRLIEWITLSVPDGRFASQRKRLAAAATAYAARGTGSNLDLITWSLGRSGRLR